MTSESCSIAQWGVSERGEARLRLLDRSVLDAWRYLVGDFAVEEANLREVLAARRERVRCDLEFGLDVAEPEWAVGECERAQFVGEASRTIRTAKCLNRGQ